MLSLKVLFTDGCALSYGKKYKQEHFCKQHIRENEVFNYNTNTIEKNDGNQLKTVDGKTQNAIVAGATWAQICVCTPFEDSHV